MKYSEIVTLRQMRPAYNIKDESKDEWRSFIANEQFNGIFRKAISAVRNNDADQHKPMWIAGTYGSGKSHAGAVLKHLFCDPVSEIRDYVDSEYGKPEYDVLRNAFYQVRETKRLFPVNFYGQQSISHEEDLSLQMQREIKRALKAAGLDITVRTDFDMYVQHIDDQPVFWENLISQDARLASVAPDTAKLKQRLSAGDTDVLAAVRSALRQSGIDIRLQSNNLLQWLLEVQQALRDATDYCGLLLIWDEFTELMTSSVGTSLLVQLQEISETMANKENDSYFLLISHPSALLTLRDEEREKTKGRYHYLSYNMEPVSAFKIMSRKFMVLNEYTYDMLRNSFFGSHEELLNIFSGQSNKAEETKQDIRNLFPLHPCTANLAAYYAREAGSSSRSVFEFLAGDSVRSFLDSEFEINDQTITADYLWDYVKEYFESDPTRFGAVVERYNSHHLDVGSQGEDYSRVFKGILLLNALNNIANSDTVTPSTANIKLLFTGTTIESKLNEILDFFNDKSIIQRQPNGNFSILFTALPTDEIQRAKDELKSSEYLYTSQVIKFGTTAMTSLQKNLSQVVRPYHLEFYGVQANEYTLLNQISNARYQPYETFLAVMVGRNAAEVSTLKDIASRNSVDERFANVVFIIMETPMGDKEYERFIEYQANAKCARSHSLPDQYETYTNQASEIIKQWVQNMRSGNALIYLRNQYMVVAGIHLTSTINGVITPLIFSSGPESLEIIKDRSSATFWKKLSAKSTVDAVLSYDAKQDIVNKCSGPARHVEFLLQDSVDDNLNWKDTLDPDHPLKKVCDYVDEMLSGRHTPKNQSFNLGDKLIGLTKPPFGLFQSYAPMAMVAFAMRKYRNFIYGTDGQPRKAQHLVDDVVEMFKAWENDKTSNKLNLIFESRDAGRVSKMLIRMFGLNRLKGHGDISSLKDARWVVQHEYSAEKGYPVWALKYSEECTVQLAEFISNVVKITGDPESMKNPSLLSNTLQQYEMLKMDIGNLLLPQVDAFRKGFLAFCKKNDVVRLSDTEFDAAFSYIKMHLAGDVGLWTEAEVNDSLKDWRINSQRPDPAPAPTPAPAPSEVHDPTNPYWPTPAPSDPSELAEKRQRAAERVIICDDLKRSIQRMIEEEDGWVIDILMKYV